MRTRGRQNLIFAPLLGCFRACSGRQPTARTFSCWPLSACCDSQYQLSEMARSRPPVLSELRSITGQQKDFSRLRGSLTTSLARTSCACARMTPCCSGASQRPVQLLAEQHSRYLEDLHSSGCRPHALYFSLADLPRPLPDLQAAGPRTRCASIRSCWSSPLPLDEIQASELPPAELMATSQHGSGDIVH